MSSFSRASDGTTSSQCGGQAVERAIPLSNEPVQQTLCRMSSSRQRYRNMSDHGRSNTQSTSHETPSWSRKAACWGETRPFIMLLIALSLHPLTILATEKTRCSQTGRGRSEEALQTG